MVVTHSVLAPDGEAAEEGPPGCEVHERSPEIRDLLSRAGVVHAEVAVVEHTLRMPRMNPGTLSGASLKQGAPKYRPLFSSPPGNRHGSACTRRSGSRSGRTPAVSLQARFPSLRCVANDEESASRNVRKVRALCESTPAPAAHRCQARECQGTTRRAATADPVLDRLRWNAQTFQTASRRRKIIR